MIRDNIEKCNNLRLAIKDHCMCYNFKEEKNRCIIIFPRGFQLDGIVHNYEKGKIIAFQNCLNRMEEEWKSSFF